MNDDTLIGVTLAMVFFTIIAFVVSVGVNREPVETVPKEPVKLSSPEQPSHGKINNALSKHNPDLFNYCDSFERDVRSNIHGRITLTDVTQTYGVTNEGDVSYIHINCTVKYRVQDNLFLYNDYLFETKTNKMKFRQVHDDYNRLVHLIKL